jgi:hypothetical protein
LENVEEARPRRIVEYGGARSAQTRAVPGRLECEREIRQQREGRRGDDPALRELLDARYTSNIAGRGVPRLEEGMRKAAPEYRPDRRLMALVPEMEQTGEEVDDDPTPELSRRHAARHGMLWRAPVE